MGPGSWLGPAGRGAEPSASGGLCALEMPVIDAQPSPFGHLTRERHIESVSRPPKKKQDFLEAEEVSPCPPARATNSPCSTWGRSCRVDAWTDSQVGALPSGCQGPPALPVGWPGCPGRLSPPHPPGVKEKEDGSCSGLQVLAGVRQLFITSKAELHGGSGPLARRGYVVGTAAHGRGPLLVTEEAYSQCCFHLCGPNRSCHLFLQDREGRVALWFCRPFRMGLGCLGCCCPMEIRAFTGDNQLVGTVRQSCSIFSHLLEVRDACGSATMKIRGVGARCRCFTRQEFQVLSSEGHAVASIWKKWPGFQEECNMDHDFFGVDMAAADLSNEDRTCLLAAAFLLNFMFFEVS
ncbi:phospholipid scramblase 3-like [Paroedura picta]|uniref:phospholipid scramblase 3-like n=1 Tax=Paroedura picta TaxID=143630 RepID=UPI004056036B